MMAGAHPAATVPDLQGRVAIVTGGGKGLGLVMGQALADAGAQVTITGRGDRELLESIAQEAERRNGRPCILPLVADVTRESDCERTVGATVERFGRVDILVNNAGLGMQEFRRSFTEETPFWTIDPAGWRRVIDTNVNGAFIMSRFAVPSLMRQGWGRIINISTNHATMRRKGNSPYGPAKAALEAATVIWAKDLAGTGVTVNSIRPGGPAWSNLIPKDLPEPIARTVLPPEVMVPPLLWLCSTSSDGHTGGRYVGKDWDSTLPPDLAAHACRRPAGWAAFDRE